MQFVRLCFFCIRHEYGNGAVPLGAASQFWTKDLLTRLLGRSWQFSLMISAK